MNTNIIIMDKNDNIIKEELYTNNLTSEENLINCITMNSYNDYNFTTPKENINKNIKTLKYGYIYTDEKFKYWVKQ